MAKNGGLVLEMIEKARDIPSVHFCFDLTLLDFGRLNSGCNEQSMTINDTRTSDSSSLQFYRKEKCSHTEGSKTKQNVIASDDEIVHFQVQKRHLNGKR